MICLNNFSSSHSAFSHFPAREDVKEAEKKDEEEEEEVKDELAAPPRKKEVTEEELEDWLDSIIS